MYPCDEKVSFLCVFFIQITNTNNLFSIKHQYNVYSHLNNIYSVCVFYKLFAPRIKSNSFLISLLFMKHADLRIFSISVITFATAVLLE